MNKLRAIISKIDGKGYKAYKSLEGKYSFEDFILYIEHVQSDPYAPPSACKVVLKNDFPEELFCNGVRRIAFEDYLNRKFYDLAARKSRKRGDGKSGIIKILKPSQQVLKRSSIVVGEDIEARFYIGLPAHGRKIIAKEARQMLLNDLPAIIRGALKYKAEEHEKILYHVKTIEDAEFIRRNLRRYSVVAFIANNSILPRKSGIEEKPLENAIPFISPPSLEIEFECPNRSIRGMGIKEGVTLIVGGAYHGKSTLLNAIAKGVYNHVPYDGREFVVTREDAVKIRAEDGRYVANVDISCFISHLPNGADTSNFTTVNASGSVSQAANICEALEVGSKLLLIDEDTSATNLMLRDRRMQELVPKEKEPITPIIDMIASFKKIGVSIIMIAGGLGEYFDVADLVIMMDEYKVRDVTDEAKEIAKKIESKRLVEKPEKIKIRNRYPLPETINPYVKNKIKIRALDIDKLQFGKYIIDLSRMEQIVERGQVKAIGDLLHKISHKFRKKCIKEVMEKIDGKIVSMLPPVGEYVEPRKYEVAFALNRLRSLKCRQG
ncbi:MAG: ATPase [Thermoplasmata archaeon]|nr:MAG: ATPase [Thermoplasmata archaeon]